LTAKKKTGTGTNGHDVVTVNKAVLGNKDRYTKNESYVGEGEERIKQQQQPEKARETQE